MEDQLNIDLDEEFEVLENEDGSADIIPVQKETRSDDGEFYGNIVEEMSEELSKIVVDLLQNIELDKQARKKRDEQYADAIRRSGLGDDAPGGAEFEGASRVVHPVIAETAIDFASNAIKELFPAEGAVKTRIEGKVTPQKLQKADRKRRHMSWQLRKQIKEFRPSLEQILSQVPMGGVQYSKLYYCPVARRPKFEFVPLDDVYVPYNAADFYSATRKTHAQKLTKIEFENRVSSGMYVDPEQEVVSELLEESAPQKANDKVEGKEQVHYDKDGMRLVYEIYCFLDIEDPKKDISYAPYILTIDASTEKPLSLYRNWDEEEKTYEALDWMTEWTFIPWRGAYAIGLTQLVGGLSAAATGALRALLDAAHINNAPTAIKLKGAQMSGQSQNISMTQITEIDSAPGVDDIRKIAMPLPFNPPSQTLFQLLGFLVDAAKGIVRTSVEATPDFSPNTAPGTYLAQIEQGMKVYSAIHARLHCSFEKNLEILHRLNRDYLEEGSPKEDDDTAGDFTDTFSEKLAYRSDYEGEMDVQPVSDPNIYSESQRYAQLQSVGQLIDKAPDLYDRRAYHRAMLQLMKVPNAEELMIQSPEDKDENPVTENIKLALGQNCGVLPDQDHLAHLQVHTDFMLSPVFGGNPAIKPHIAAAWLNHVIQHMLMLYGTEVKDMIEKASGHKIKDLMSDDSEVMDALSKAAAVASPMAISSTEQLLEKVLPIIAETMQYVQTLQPPALMDPAQANLQVAQINAQLKQQELQHQAGMKDKELQQESSVKQYELQHQASIKDKELQRDAELRLAEIQAEQAKEAQKIAAAAEVEKLKSQTELIKNREDNLTALKITEIRLASGAAGGNFKNGNSLDNPGFAEGGLVEGLVNEEQPDPLVAYINRLQEMANKEPPRIEPPVVNVDLSPVAEAIKSIPQQDLTPILEALANQKQPMNYIDTSQIAEAIRSANNHGSAIDISPLIEKMNEHNEKLYSAISGLSTGQEERLASLPELIQASIGSSNKELLSHLKKRPKVKIDLTRDANNKLTAQIKDEEEES